jgi:hypothetical protein
MALPFSMMAGSVSGYFSLSGGRPSGGKNNPAPPGAR